MQEERPRTGPPGSSTGLSSAFEQTPEAKLKRKILDDLEKEAEKTSRSRPGFTMPQPGEVNVFGADVQRFESEQDFYELPQAYRYSKRKLPKEEKEILIAQHIKKNDLQADIGKVDFHLKLFGEPDSHASLGVSEGDEILPETFTRDCGNFDRKLFTLGHTCPVCNDGKIGKGRFTPVPMHRD